MLPFIAPITPGRLARPRTLTIVTATIPQPPEIVAPGFESLAIRLRPAAQMLAQNKKMEEYC
jgi:hypothetical protein